ncbi:MAG: hypothetical protein FJZ47_17975 [Candidatus Tectomicrobia bacterium]|uniref:Uncharacterized protein n=1 Tax=Tectimicrobiota bacterium TaxID=2528274 RepID=A0A937W5P9_UNCTE|nr:hypothetical protein [Candidatus Tectomicrobia bacterium]
MPTPMVAVEIPETLFLRLKRAAEVTHRSVEELAATTLAAALPLAPDLPPEIAQELAVMHLFSDDALWAATTPAFAPTEACHLQQLSQTASERPLTPAEQAEQSHLIAAYRRAVLRRAKALAVLAQRGHPLPIASATDVTDHGES